VSRRHAEVRPFGTGFLVVDLGSTNGTKVNGTTVSEHQLKDGDAITVGATRIRFDAS
jgi:pSer/pThr/pTyr-binding forkhead associated (FHA) protein